MQQRLEDDGNDSAIGTVQCLEDFRNEISVHGLHAFVVFNPKMSEPPGGSCG